MSDVVPFNGGWTSSHDACGWLNAIWSDRLEAEKFHRRHVRFCDTEGDIDE